MFNPSELNGFPGWPPPSPHEILLSIERRLGWLQGGQEATADALHRRLDRQDQSLNRIETRVTTLETRPPAFHPSAAPQASRTRLSWLREMQDLLALPWRELAAAALVALSGLASWLGAPSLKAALITWLGG